MKPTIGRCTAGFAAGGTIHQLEMVLVEATRGRPFEFGDADHGFLDVELRDFFISCFPVTQALWTYVMGDNPSVRQGQRKPVENISWIEITRSGGFLDRLNESSVLSDMKRRISSLASARFRLPSETEWEYAARGGPHWAQRLRFSGSNDVDAVAWYKDNSGNATHDVGDKAPNQLGIYDMSGNVWEWCQDSHVSEVKHIPTDGSAFVGDSSDRILRGGCHHNWAQHCTVSKRYEIAKDYRDGCIGLRLVLTEC